MENPPYGAEENVREEHARTVLEVLGGIRASEIAGVLGGLMGVGGEEVDVLVKYLYAAPSEFCVAWSLELVSGWKIVVWLRC